jgi:hypothetical protein
VWVQVWGEKEQINVSGCVDMFQRHAGVSIGDFHALGGAAKPSHDALSFNFQGLDARLSGVEGAKVIKKILS